MRKTDKKLAGIQYLGVSGISNKCRDAIISLFQNGVSVEKARVVTKFDKHSNTHCIVLRLEYGDLIAIKSGFSSGYNGSGPSAFSYVLSLFEVFKIEVDEIEVEEGIIQRIDNSCLTVEDIERVVESKPKLPNRVYDYLLKKDWDSKDNERTWTYFKPIIPYSILDKRLSDLAISFWDSPDEKIMTAYRRFEDILRKRTGLTESSVALITKTYRGEEAKLHWDGIEKGEAEGRIQLMIGTFMAYRNPRAHKEEKHSDEYYLQEFMQINHIYKLEGNSKLKNE